MEELCKVNPIHTVGSSGIGTKEHSRLGTFIFCFTVICKNLCLKNPFQSLKRQSIYQEENLGIWQILRTDIFSLVI